MIEEKKECWKPVTEFPTHFEISNFGNVRSVRWKMIRKTHISNAGYEQVCLRIGTKLYNRSVHRLVALAFIRQPHPSMNVVNHIDGNKLNNCEWNLEWVTSSENNQHAYRCGLKTADSNKVAIVVKKDGIESVFDSVRAFAQFIVTNYSDGVNRQLHTVETNISRTLRGRLKSYLKYKVRYKDEDYTSC